MIEQLTDEEIAKLRALIAIRSEKASCWTSVKNRLPPCDGFYLVYRDEFSLSQPLIRRFSKQGRFQGSDRYISHWMPMPMPPQKESE